VTDDLKEALNDFADWHDMDGEDVSAKLLRDAVARIEQLEAALREIKGWNDNQDRRSLKIAAVIDAALAGGEKNGQAE
jgi:hypothetical protein